MKLCLSRQASFTRSPECSCAPDWCRSTLHPEQELDRQPTAIWRRLDTHVRKQRRKKIAMHKRTCKSRPFFERSRRITASFRAAPPRKHRMFACMQLFREPTILIVSPARLSASRLAYACPCACACTADIQGRGPQASRRANINPQIPSRLGLNLQPTHHVQARNHGNFWGFACAG